MEAKIVVVTGALTGLGYETSRQLAKRGYRVILTGRDEARGAKALKDLADEGLKLDFRPLDVSIPDSVENFVNHVMRDFQRVDVLVNNAGVYLDDQEDKMPLADEAALILKTFSTNTLGAFMLCRKLIPQMVKNRYGRIVNVSSGMGQLSDMNGGAPGYRMSKTALNAVTRMFAYETRGSNVLINSVCPGWVRTKMGGPGATRSIEKGVETILWLATLGDNSASGGFYRDLKEIPW